MIERMTFERSNKNSYLRYCFRDPWCFWNSRFSKILKRPQHETWRNKSIPFDAWKRRNLSIRPGRRIFSLEFHSSFVWHSHPNPHSLIDVKENRDILRVDRTLENIIAISLGIYQTCFNSLYEHCLTTEKVTLSLWFLIFLLQRAEKKSFSIMLQEWYKKHCYRSHSIRSNRLVHRISTKCSFYFFCSLSIEWQVKFLWHISLSQSIDTFF